MHLNQNAPTDLRTGPTHLRIAPNDLSTAPADLSSAQTDLSRVETELRGVGDLVGSIRCSLFLEVARSLDNPSDKVARRRSA